MVLSLFKLLIKFSNSEQKNAVSKVSQPKLKNTEVLHNRKIQQQQQYVEELQQQILDGEIKAEQELEHDQAAINQQIREGEILFNPSLTMAGRDRM